MKAALLLVDVQQDFLSRPGLVPDATELERRLAGLIAAFRRNRLPVLHSRTLIGSDGRGRMPHWVRLGRLSCVAGSAGAAPPPALTEAESEPVLAKPFFSAFGNPVLERTLRAASVDTLIIAGVYTHACVRATALDAYQAGFAVWIAADCIASDAPLHARLTLDYLDARAGEVLPSAAIADRLGLTRPAAAADAPIETTPVGHVAGRWQAASGHELWIQHDPADWRRCLAAVPLGRSADVERAATGLAAGQRQWSRRAIDDRAALLSQWADALLAREDSLVELLVREVGKPATDGRAEVRYAIELLRATLGHADPDAAALSTGQRAWVRSRPLGVVALVTPWNNPVAIPAGKIAPALLWGNAVVWKPALQAPGIARSLIESLFEAGIAPDCMSTVLGDAQTAQAMVSRTEVAAVSFTGSIAAGREVALLCAAGGKRLQAEMGGNNAVIVGRSADTAAVAAKIAVLAFSYAGQRCTAPRRLIVARDVFDAFAEALLAEVVALRIGEPSRDDTQVGPLISRAQQSRVGSVVEASVAEGGKLLCGGRVPPGFGHGCWFEPTVLHVTDRNCAAVREETFGPVAMLQRADDFAAAIAACNDVPHGLVASLYSNEADEHRQFLELAEAGILRVNDLECAIHPDAPFGGWKASGLGPPEHGSWDRAFYSLPQAVYGHHR